jgi:hypothetical protein
MTAPAGQPASTSPATTFESGSSNTSGTVVWRASRRITNVFFGGYNVAGNLSNDPRTAVVLPLQYGPFGSYTLDYGVTHRDSLLTRLNGQYTTTPYGLCTPPTATFCRIESPVISLQELARRRLSTSASISVGAGVSAAIVQRDAGPAWAILPTGEVRYIDRLGVAGALDTSTLTLAATLAPAVDINTGQINNLVTVTAMAVRRVAHDVYLTVSVGGLRSVPPYSFPITGVNGSVSARWQVNRRIDISCGLSGFFQTQEFAVGAGAIPANNGAEIGFVSMVARLPTLKF